MNITKKQIYAEDYQQQFAEQLAGGAEAMQKAVSKWAGRDVGTDEMKAMMKDGKLIAKEILPLLAKEMAELARNGEALKNALKGLAVIEDRMKTSFDDMLANVYRGGLSEGLKDLYTTLDRMFWVLSKGDSGLGKFLKGFLEGAKESVEWLWDHLTLLRIMLEEEFGITGANMEMLGKVSYYGAIFLALNSISGLMKWFISAPLLNGIVALAGKILSVGTATETVAAALAPVAAVVAAIAAAAAILNLAQSKYNDFSAEQKADWQQKMTTMNASATQGYYTKSGLEQLGSQGNLPNTNNYAPIMQAVADTNRQLQETIINAPPLRVDVRVEESELSKFIKFRVDEGIQRQVQSILPTGAPSLVTK